MYRVEANVAGVWTAQTDLLDYSAAERAATPLRKQFIHTKKRWGFTSDVMRNTATTGVEYANHIAKLTHKNKIERSIEEAHEALKGMPDTERANLKLYLNEIESRARMSVNPGANDTLADKVVNGMNRFAFLWLLSSGATAATQFSGMPVRVMPRLWKDHGHVAASAKWAKYLQIWKVLGTTYTEPDGTKIWVSPSIGQSSLVKTNPILRRAYEAGYYEHALFKTQASEILSGNSTPRNKARRGVSKAMSIAYRGMTAMFNASEQISREATYMMAFELEYGKTKDFDHSVEYAVKAVNDTLGNYSEFNRPSLWRGPVTRAIFLFKQYAINTTWFFVNNLRKMLGGGEYTKKERAKAAQELGTVLLMGGLFHGVAGMPLYSTIAMAVDLALRALDGDDDEARRAAKNPYSVHDSKYRFENDWMPEHFGDKYLGADGRMHSLANILLKGPVSELTDVNMGSRTSFDGLWFREPQGQNDTWAEYIQNAIISNIPGASINVKLAQGIEDLGRGNIQRGLEGIAPALIRGGLTANRLASEGSETRGGEQIMDPEEFTDANIIAQTVGFQPTSLAKYQGLRAQQKKLKANVSGRRSELTREFNESYMEGASRDELLDVVERMREYNATVQDPTLVITWDDIRRSLSSYAGRRKYNYRGFDLDEDDFAYFANDILEAGNKE